LTGGALHLAGKPSRVGSLFARIFGWLVIGVGLSFALGIGAIAHFIFPAGFVGLAVSLPLALVTLLIGGLLLRGGRRLDEKGASDERSARSRAVFALAAQRGGVLTASDVASALEMPPNETEELLQSLAREQYDAVTVDVDPNGTLVYRFVEPTRVRVDPDLATSPNRAEWERLEAEEAERTAASRSRARPR
jgi:hypothetical protein